MVAEIVCGVCLISYNQKKSWEAARRIPPPVPSRKEAKIISKRGPKISATSLQSIKSSLVSWRQETNALF